MTKKAAPKQDVLERYLLGEVSEDERVEIEQGYFADDGLFDQLVDVQNDLVDAYAQGTLPAVERKRFEERFLTSSSGVGRVEFARALQRKIAARTARKPEPVSFRQFAIAASVAIIVTAAAMLTFLLQRRQELPITDSRPQAQQQQRAVPPAPVQAQTQTAPLRREQAPAALVTVLLTAGGTRESEAAPPLVLRPAPQFVQVELVLEDDRYDSYAAELQDVEGRVLWKEKSLRARTGQSGRTVAASVPARLLPPGDYVVVLQGIRGGKASDINNYTFTVVALPIRQK
jgi:hypothetical protein